MRIVRAIKLTIKDYKRKKGFYKKNPELNYIHKKYAISLWRMFLICYGRTK